MAPVGHAPMHALHVPQCDVDGGRGGQRQVGVDLAEEEVRARVTRQEQRVLAAPAEARLGRERDFEHRRAVGEDAITERPDFRRDAVDETREAGAQHLVVVAPERIPRDVGARRIGERRLCVRTAGPVVHPRRDDAKRAGHELGGTRARGAVARHVRHVAVTAGGEPALQMLLGLAELGVGDADFLEAELAAPLRDGRGERCPCVACRACRRPHSR